MAGRVGFEPTWVFRPNSFSRRARSTAPSPPRVVVGWCSGALPCRYTRRAAKRHTARPPFPFVATLGRLERPTSSSAGKRSNPLSYRVSYPNGLHLTTIRRSLQAMRALISTSARVPWRLAGRVAAEGAGLRAAQWAWFAPALRRRGRQPALRRGRGRR